MKNYFLEDIKRELDATLDYAKVYNGATIHDENELNRDERDMFFYFNKTLNHENYNNFPIERRSLAFLFFKRTLILKKMYDRYKIKNALLDLSKA